MVVSVYAVIACYLHAVKGITAIGMFCLIKEDDIMGMGIGSIGSEQVKTLMTTSNTSDKSKKSNKTSSGITGLFSFSPKKKTTKKKKLSYNFKKISNQIMSSKTSTNAGKALTKARTTYIMLLIQQRSSDYDEEELKSALEHAEEMVRVAKKRKKHMEQEERIIQGSEPTFYEEIEETEESSDLDSMESGKYDGELSAEEMQEIARELEEMTRESIEDSLMELADDLLSVSYGNMSDEEIEELKKKHRAEELRDIMEADMKYLKALFDRLQKEKQQSASARSSSGSASEAESPVSLEIAGVDVAVQAEAAPVEVAEGGTVDVSV